MCFENLPQGNFGNRHMPLLLPVSKGVVFPCITSEPPVCWELYNILLTKTRTFYLKFLITSFFFHLTFVFFSDVWCIFSAFLWLCICRNQAKRIALKHKDDSSQRGYKSTLDFFQLTWTSFSISERENGDTQLFFVLASFRGNRSFSRYVAFPFLGLCTRHFFVASSLEWIIKWQESSCASPVAFGMCWAVVTRISPVYTCVYKNCMHDFSWDFAILNAIFQMSDRQCACEVNRGQSKRKQSDTISLYLLSCFLPYK